jgi:DNA-binding PadR family transcriptional regulator
MTEKSTYRKVLERDIFYSYEAPFLIFSDYACDTICEKYGIRRRHLRAMAAVRLFVNIRQFARPAHLMKLLRRNKYRLSPIMTDLVDKGLVEKTKPEIVERFENKGKVGNKNAYYRLTPKGKKLVKEFHQEILRLVRQFDEDRANRKYWRLKVDEKGEIVEK